MSDTFTLFLRSSLRKTICQWTNHKGGIVYGSSRKPVDDGEFKVVLGVVILIDIYKFNNESVAQLWSTLDGQPIFNRPMSRERYQQILCVFHSQDNIIGLLTSCNQSEKCLKLGTFTCMIPATLADKHDSGRIVGML